MSAIRSGVLTQETEAESTADVLARDSVDVVGVWDSYAGDVKHALVGLSGPKGGYELYGVDLIPTEYGVEVRFAHKTDPTRAYAVAVSAFGTPTGCTCPSHVYRRFVNFECKHRKAARQLVAAAFGTGK
jgi:hypothetical protein